MGGLFSGSSKTESTSTSSTGPSSFQQPYLTDLFNSAQSNYDSKASTPWYTGELYAGMSDQAKADLQTTRDYATNQGLGTANQLTSLGTSLLGNYDKANSAIDSYTALANGDATASNIAAASQYAANPYLDSQIDAANRDVSRTLNEQTLPGIDRQASGTGNINSSRAGVAAGIAQRGAADRMADTAATLRGNAYSQGLSLAQTDRSNQLSALGNVIGAYTNLAGQGTNALSSGAQIGTNALSTLNAANATEQADRQGQDTAAYNSWYGNDTRQNDLLSQYAQLVASNQWGSTGTTTGTQTQTSSPSLLGSIAGLATGALGAASSLGWAPLASTAAKAGSQAISLSPGLLSSLSRGSSGTGGAGWSPFS